jgi:Sigma-70, region 4
VRQLPETQRTALLLREIDALSYEQIAQAMETTVPSVKSLLVRARISLAEAAEARKLSCAEVRLELGEVAEGLVKLSAPARRHTRDCDRCRSFKRQLKENNHALAVIFPVGPLLLVKQLLFAKLGSTASAGSAHVASGASATVGAGAVASAGAAGGTGAGGVFTLGAGALTTKAVAGLAAAAIVSAGAVAANQSAPHPHRAVHVKTAYVSTQRDPYEPLLAAQRAQPLSLSATRSRVIASDSARRHKSAAKLNPAAEKAPTTPAPLPAGIVPAGPAVLAAPARPPQPEAPAGQLTQLTSESTQLPASATAAPEPSRPTAIASPDPAGAPPSPGPSPSAAPAGGAEAPSPSSDPVSASSDPASASSNPASASSNPTAAALVSSQSAAPRAPASSSVEPTAPTPASAAPLVTESRPQPVGARHPDARAKGTFGSPLFRRHTHRRLP